LPCPPCNQLNETVFNSPEFKKAQENFIILKLDADSPASWSLKSKYHITGYPTVVLATDKADEITRIIGFHPKSEFVAAMNKAYKDRSKGLEDLKLRAESNDRAAYDAGLSFLDREDYYKANYYLLIASRHWSLADIKRNKLMSAQLGLHSKGESLEDKKVYLKLLKKALEWYPRQIEVFDRTDNLIDVAKDIDDKDSGTEAYNIRISTALWYVNHPKALRGTEWVKGDLYEVLGRAYETLDDKQKSLDAFAQGAKEYSKEISRSGLNEDSERGYNLERIYCLWKSGQIDHARGLYDKFEKQFPDEFTYYYQHAKLLKEIKEYKEGIEKAEKAYSFSYGDNKLRVTALLADLYSSANDKKKAIAVLNRVIDHFELPPDKSIRTHRYYEALVEMRKKFQG
jgi:tetratricopeptide (TPR) repeat protein